MVLADDQALIRAGFRAVIDATDGMQVVGEADDGVRAVELARAGRADVVLMDIRMPGGDGITATRAITSDGRLADCRVIILTTFEVEENVIAAMQAGASGFLDKGVDPSTLLDAIRAVAAGEALLTPSATRSLLSALSKGQLEEPVDENLVGALTEREREVVSLAGQGLSNAEIAAALVLSPLTVKTHVSNAMGKLAVRDRAQLVVAAIRSGLTRVRDLD